MGRRLHNREDSWVIRRDGVMAKWRCCWCRCTSCGPRDRVSRRSG